MPIVTREQVQNALRMSADDGDIGDDLAAKISQAEDIVLDYLKFPAEAAYWDSETAPERVKSAIIMVVGCLLDEYENSNELLSGLQGGPQSLANPIVALLYRLRDPAIA
jgi:hypothetical protein